MAVIHRNYLVEQLEAREVGQIFVEASLYLLVNLFALFGNLLVCFAVYKAPSLQNVGNVFVINLALSDILVALICIPLSIAVIISGRWPFSEAVCDFNGFSIFAFSMVSQVGMALVAANRYFAVVKPQFSRKIFSSRNVCVMVCGLWLLPSIATLPPLFGWGFYEFNAGKAFCLYPFYASKSYTFMVEVLFIILPMKLIIFSYFKIFKEMRRSRRQVGTTEAGERTLTALEKREYKVSVTMFVAFLAFASCWGPVSVIDFIDTFREETTLPRGVYMFNSLMIFLSSALNPLIYWVTNARFRNVFKTTINSMMTTTSNL